MANKPGEANFFPNVPEFPSMGVFQPIYGKFDLTTYIQGASDYEIMAFLVGKYNACLEAYGTITKLSTDTITACKQLQDWINSWFTNLDVQEELNNKIDSMVQDGSFGQLLHQTFDTQINQQTTNAVTAWLVANVTPTGSAVVVDKSLSIEGAAADAKMTGNKTTLNANVMALISAQKKEIDGKDNIFKFIHGSHTASADGELEFNPNDEFVMTVDTEINLNNATSIAFSDFENYSYSLIVTYGTKWFYNKVTSNPFNLGKTAKKIFINARRTDSLRISDYDLTKVIATVFNDSKVTYMTYLSELYNLPKTIKKLENNTDLANANSVDAYIVNDNVTIDNYNVDIFPKAFGGNGKLTFTNWNPVNLSNTFDVSRANDYIYKCMHFPHSGNYQNVEYKDPTIDSVESLPFKLPIGSIYLNTDKAEEFNGLVRILAVNMYGFKNGQWYEVQNGNITWAKIYNLPWGTSSGTDVPFFPENRTMLINLVNNKLTKDNVLHFGTTNTYATIFDFYIVKFIVRCNKDACGLKISIDSRNEISGQPVQIISSSRIFEVPNSETLTAYAHNIPDSVYDNVITNFNNFIKLKIPHLYSGYIETGKFIIALNKKKNSVTTIKDIVNGTEDKITIINGVITATNNNIVLNEHTLRLDIAAKNNFYMEMNVSNTDAIANYNFDLM